MAIEAQVRVAIRDALNRGSRKPFYWGGLAGYHQLAAIGQALRHVPDTEPETRYLRQLRSQLERAVERNRSLAQDLAEAHRWLRRIAACLRYPPDAFTTTHITGAEVQRDMQLLLQQFPTNFKGRPAQAALHRAWRRLWATVGPDLLHCYDIPGLPPDNLKLESLFGRLRRHQRRISGRKSTQELRDFGHCQVLFIAENQANLLHQLRQVPVATYQAHRRRLAEAEAPRQFLHRLHRDPVKTMHTLIDQHAARRTALASTITLANQAQWPQPSYDLGKPGLHNPVLISHQAQKAPSLATTSSYQWCTLPEAF
jgi:hypothetical protein